MKTFSLVVAATLLLSSLVTAVRFDYDSTFSGSERCALINVAMDESLGMEDAQAFMKNKALPSMAQSLYDTHSYDKVYLCSGGFGLAAQSYSHHFQWRGCTTMTNQGSYPLAYGTNTGVVNWRADGFQEDGWAGMLWSMGNVTDSIAGDDLLTTCRTLDKNLILVTDEERDSRSMSGVTYNEVATAIDEYDYTLNAILDIDILSNANNFGMKISTGPSGNTIYTYDPTAGGLKVTFSVDNNVYTSFTTGDGNTNADYTNLLVNKPGYAWNINSLGLPGREDTFADIFVRIKVAEIAGTVAELGGDPHITTWKNEHYEYHGQCDLVMMKDSQFADKLGLNIHIRTKIVRFWSYIKTVAIRIGNDILEIEGSGDEDDAEPHYWFNYEYQGELESGIGGFPIVQIAPSAFKRQYKIDLSPKYPGQHIVVQLYKEFVRIKFQGDDQVFGNTVGLLGDYSTGKTFARDGTTVLDDYTNLGNEWQVLPIEPKLFHEIAHPQFPEPCIQPEDPRGERKRRLTESTISVEQAEAACSSLVDPLATKDCVYDVLATQDMDMIGAF